MALSKISFHECDFVQAAVSKDFECPVCFEMLKDPYLTACCGNHFCESCIAATKNSNNECPLCKEKPVIGIVDKKLQRRINELEVYCLQKKHGCSWVGRLGELTKHLEAGNTNGCNYSVIPCSFSCGNHLFRHKLHEHLSNECSLRPYTCKFCGHSSTYAAVSEHFSKCLEYPVLCPNSCTNEEMKRGDLDRHLLVCPNQLVLCCFSEMGCTETIKRCLLPQHMETSWLQHQMMMCNAFKQIKIENETLRKESEMLKIENDMLKRDSEEMKKAQETPDYWINGYKLMAEGVMKTHWREYLFSLAVVSTNIPEPVCPVILKWTGYETLKNGAKEGKHVFYYMRPFYTHSGGYKMQVRVYPNGTEGGKGTHLSVYCHLVPGKYDDTLKWPFKGTVSISILNQVEDSKHLNKEVWSSNHVVPYETAKKPVGVRNENGWGYPQFVKIDEIEGFATTKQYLMNDALFIRISAVL